MFNNDDSKIIQENLGRLELSTVKIEVILATQGYFVNATKQCKLSKIIMLTHAFDNLDCLDCEHKGSLVAQINSV